MNHILVYDLDDTLISQKDYAFSGLKAVDHYLQFQHKIGGFLPLAKQLYNQGHRGNIFNLTLDTMALSYDNAMIQDLVHIYRNHSPEITLLPDAATTLHHFHSHYSQALITDGLVLTQQHKINALKLGDFLDPILCTESLGGTQFWKPHPLAFQKLMQHFNLPPAHFTYIADNPLKDFIAPNTLGWNSIRILRNGSEYQESKAPAQNQAQNTIHSLTELISLFPVPTPS